MPHGHSIINVIRMTYYPEDIKLCSLLSGLNMAYSHIGQQQDDMRDYILESYGRGGERHGLSRPQFRALLTFGRALSISQDAQENAQRHITDLYYQLCSDIHRPEVDID